MKRIVMSLIVVLNIFSICATQKVKLIPYPNYLVEQGGEFMFKNELTVNMPATADNEFKYFTQVLANENFVKVSKAKRANILFKKVNNMGKEAYELYIGKEGIRVLYTHNSGCFYAIQTLRQLMRLKGDGSYVIPACVIKDRPNYAWRSFMLDESRHFKGKAFVKQMLDQLAYIKMNVFHWHLVDDQGWRIQIKKYPKLTDVGAWRDSTQIARVPKGTTPKFYSYAHGGFYTQDDIKEIVAYAAERHITVVPEIEMPGHACAAIAAYPWLSCTNEEIRVNCQFGIFKPTYNVADERVFTFFQDVLETVMALFPSKIIHIGGDEVKYDQWLADDAVKALMKERNFKTPSDLHVYFVNRISKFIVSKGYRTMGWNDILGKNVHEWAEAETAQEKLSSNTIVNFWKGQPELLADAIKQGYSVVNSNHWDTYLDYTYKVTPLEKSYNFSPLPKNMSVEYKKNVLGFGCQMWSEYIPKVTDAYRQIFPRIAAYAEVGWTNDDLKDFNRFSSNLIELKRYWDSKGIVYWDN